MTDHSARSEDSGGDIVDSTQEVLASLPPHPALGDGYRKNLDYLFQVV
jgi:hypothetical protein